MHFSHTINYLFFLFSFVSFTLLPVRFTSSREGISFLPLSRIHTPKVTDFSTTLKYCSTPRLHTQCSIIRRPTTQKGSTGGYYTDNLMYHYKKFHKLVNTMGDFFVLNCSDPTILKTCVRIVDYYYFFSIFLF